MGRVTAADKPALTSEGDAGKDQSISSNLAVKNRSCFGS
jgi:hypothetical protein